MSDAGSPSRRPERVLVDLAAMERMDLAPPPPARFAGKGSGRPRFMRARAAGSANLVTLIERAALVTIGRLAREGALVLCSYVEFEPPATDAERWRGTWRELVGDVPLTTIPPAIDRSMLGDDVFRGDAQAGALARLCAKLRHAEGGREVLRFDEPPASDESAPIRSAERFGQLAARVQGDRLAQLFHLWSAELADCRYWLTLDATLPEFVRERVQPGLSPGLRCEPVLPEQLLRLLGVTERDRLPGAGSSVVSLRPT